MDYLNNSEENKLDIQWIRYFCSLVSGYLWNRINAFAFSGFCYRLFLSRIHSFFVIMSFILENIFCIMTSFEELGYTSSGDHHKCNSILD